MLHVFCSLVFVEIVNIIGSRQFPYLCSRGFNSFMIIWTQVQVTHVDDYESSTLALQHGTLNLKRSLSLWVYHDLLSLRELEESNMVWPTDHHLFCCILRTIDHGGLPDSYGPKAGVGGQRPLACFFVFAYCWQPFCWYTTLGCVASCQNSWGTIQLEIVRSWFVVHYWPRIPIWPPK